MTDLNETEPNETEPSEHQSLADAASAMAAAEAGTAVADTKPAPAPVRLPPRNVTERHPICTVGRRKSATARVRMFPGAGSLLVNGRSLDSYFVRVEHRRAAVAPLRHCEVAKDIDVLVNVRGGGDTGQSGAVSLAVSRALAELRPELEQRLRDGGFMTRDAREVERTKYGRPGARRGFQFSKR
jgi:small subunit ribosomal protein S9